ncbi:MAG: transcriptional repressor [Candidatus Eisenbacteria bacterium]|uniref:Transcriptional repressor n=1 Tax=Eiseniibacteriota bacterium TaxID=2212470 RepID=A0A948RY94_UNCEI|nr:transcriptional repressor [Candidatus Eisenbacteria bacterium]
MPQESEELAHGFEQRCRQSGLAVTPQRRAIYATLSQRKDHPTADLIYAQVKKQHPEMSRATVYRVLETFAQLGIIRKLPHPGSAVRYDPDTRRHHHLLCLRCGEITDFNNLAFDDLKIPHPTPEGFRIMSLSVSIQGICSKCQTEEKETTPGGES